MINKNQFVELINFIIKLEEKEQTFNDALQEFCDDADFTGFHSQTTQFLVDWVSSWFDERYENIPWWLWDCPDAGRGSDDDCSIFEENDARYIIKNPEDLYDYLVGQLEPVSNNPMKVNGFYCRKCKMIVESRSLHDWQKCNCGNYVDGGLECPRRGGNFEDMLDLNNADTYKKFNTEVFTKELFKLGNVNESE